LRPNQRARLPVGIEEDDIGRLLGHTFLCLWLRSLMRLRSCRNRSCKPVPDQVGISDIQELKLMPEKATLERARRDRRAGKAPSTQAGEFVREEMDHIREGKHGARSSKQAIAIGLSKARRAGVNLPNPPRSAKSSTRRSAAAARRAARRTTRRQARRVSRTRARGVKRALRREGRKAASRRNLSRQARSAARRRTAAARRRSAQRAVRTKGPRVRRAAARRAAQTRRRRRHATA
jgi:hypothetical protein